MKKVKYIFGFLFLVLMLVSCSKLTNLWKFYEIKPGKHYSSHRSPAIIFGRASISLQVMIHKSMVFEPPHSNGWSKISGFSEGYHKHNGIRLAWKNIWNCDSSAIITQLGVYTYKQKQKPSYEDGTCFIIDTVFAQQVVTVRMDRGFDHYNIYYQGSHFTSPAKPIDDFPLNTTVGYINYPYLGGEFTLNEKVIVPIKIIHK